mgnify:CR=1 FL=1
MTDRGPLLVACAVVAVLGGMAMTAILHGLFEIGWKPSAYAGTIASMALAGFYWKNYG